MSTETLTAETATDQPSPSDAPSHAQPSAPAPSPPKRLALALQGGGAHGAFTWGALDALLEEPRIEIVAISGASAGALNGVLLAEGYAAGGREGARAKLRDVWGRISAVRAFSPVQASVPNKLGEPNLDGSPAYWAVNVMSRLLSPYEFNPIDFNQLREVLRVSIDGERVRAQTAIALHISATDALTGRARIFAGHEITPEHLVAAACLPNIFQAVEIDGTPYWDGCFTADPAMEPLLDGPAEARGFDDVLCITLTPMRRRHLSRGRRDIEERINEIAFNANFLRQVDHARRIAALCDAGELHARHRPPFLHGIHGDETLEPLSASSKVNAEWLYMTGLFEAGRTAGRGWIAARFADLGLRDTLDVPSPRM